jgi:arabinose-5-phosphate isomerase
MIPASRVPVVQSQDSLKSALDVMTKFSLGVCIIENHTGVLEGILTDGDLRRLILNVQNPLPALLVTEAIRFGTKNPKFVLEDSSLVSAIELMDEKKIWDLPVLNSEGKFIGVINRHNLE